MVNCFREISGSTLLIFMLFTCVGISSQPVYTKDQVYFGETNDLISSFKNTVEEEYINLEGITIDIDKYATCICEVVIPRLYSYEIVAAYENGTTTELFLKEENFKMLLECAKENINYHDDYVVNGFSVPELEEFTVNNCINTIINSSPNEGIWTFELAKEYCECSMNRLLKKGYSFRQILDVDSEDSETYNEVVLPCLDLVFQFKDSELALNKYVAEDIIGYANYTSVELVDFFNVGYKIKINIDGVTKYYLFDTGASELCIDHDMERELLLNGTLRREDYLNEEDYVLANNEIIKAQHVKVDNVKIGDYTVNNVIIAIFENGSLLCGKGFLDKFKNWEIDKDKNELILSK